MRTKKPAPKYPTLITLDETTGEPKKAIKTEEKIEVKTKALKLYLQKNKTNHTLTQNIKKQ